MDQYSSLEEQLSDSERTASRLLSKVYESREELGVWSMIQLLKLKKDHCILQLAKLNIAESSPLEIAAIQGKIKVLESFLHDIQTDLNKRRKSAESSAVLSDRETFMDEDDEPRAPAPKRTRYINKAREAGLIR